LRALGDARIFFLAGRPHEWFEVSPGVTEILDRFARPATIGRALPDADESVIRALSDWERRGWLLRTARTLAPSHAMRSVDRVWASRVESVRARATRVRPTRKETVGGLPLVVVDGFFTRREVAEASKAFAESVYRNFETADERKMYPHDVLELPAAVPFVECITAVAAQVFPRAELAVYRAYCNRLRYGDVSLAHNDSDPPSITTLYYANERWEDEWAGETMFYGSADEATVAVAPRPGRLVIFDGRMRHRGGPPSRTCHEGRLSVAVKYWVRTGKRTDRRRRARGGSG
jgi:hypothetical protein